MPPYVGEIRMFGGNFPPNGWMFCQGQTLPISENEILFQLIGTTYGGDGQETFQLPNLGGRLPAHQGTSPQGNTMQLGEMGGVPTVTLTTQQLPIHTHPFMGAQAAGNEANAGGNLAANSSVVTPYINQAPDGNMGATAIGPTGGSQPHDNMQPYLCINFIISLFGVFPSQT
jgi:microcystin-dependent protein